MSLFEWAVSSVLGSPNVQQAGAIDVIAVRRSDGSISCSPFHVKLGKIPKKGEKKIVTLKVNGKDVNLSMKLGPAGEAFFVERTRERTHEEIWNSPPMSPGGPFSRDYENAAENFPLTRSINSQSERSHPTFNTTKENDHGKSMIEPSTSANNIQGLLGRQRSYSESDLTIVTNGNETHIQDSNNKESNLSSAEDNHKEGTRATPNKLNSRDVSIVDLALQGQNQSHSTFGDVGVGDNEVKEETTTEEHAKHDIVRFTPVKHHDLSALHNSHSSVTRRDRSYSDMSAVSMHSLHTPTITREGGGMHISPYGKQHPTVGSLHGENVLSGDLITKDNKVPKIEIPPLELPQESKMISTSVEEVGVDVEVQATPSVSWIWSWGALPKKSKPHAKTSHHVAEAKLHSSVTDNNKSSDQNYVSVGGSKLQRRDAEIRQTADDEDDERRYTSLKTPPSSIPRIAPSTAQRGSTLVNNVNDHAGGTCVMPSSLKLEGFDHESSVNDVKIRTDSISHVHADDTTISLIPSRGTTPLISLGNRKSLDNTPVGFVKDTASSPERAKHNSTMPMPSSPPKFSQSLTAKLQHFDELNSLSVKSEAKPPRVNKIEVPEFRETADEVVNDVNRNEEVEEGELEGVSRMVYDMTGIQSMHAQPLPQLTQTLIPSEETFSPNDESPEGHPQTYRMSSEPIPTNSQELLHVLNQHQLEDVELLTLNIPLLQNADVVVLLDDYLLTIVVVEKLLQLSVSLEDTYEGQREDTQVEVSVEVAAESITVEGGENVSDTKLKLTDDLVQRVCSDLKTVSWVGKKVSEWNLTADDMTLNSTAEKNSVTDVSSVNVTTNISTKADLSLNIPTGDAFKVANNERCVTTPAGIKYHHHTQRDNTFVSWHTDNHLGWRESFPDLVHAYKLLQTQHSRANLTAESVVEEMEDSTQLVGQSPPSDKSQSSQSHDDFVKAFLSTTPNTSSNSLSKLQSQQHSSSAQKYKSHHSNLNLNSNWEYESGYFIPHTRSNSNDDCDNNSGSNSLRNSNELSVFNTQRTSTLHSLLLPLSEGNEGEEVQTPTAVGAATFATDEYNSIYEPGQTTFHVTSTTSLATATADVSGDQPLNVNTDEKQSSSNQHHQKPELNTMITKDELQHIELSNINLHTHSDSLDTGDHTDNDAVSLEDIRHTATLQHGGVASLQDTTMELDAVSLQDIEFEDICPEPAGGDFYDSDTDSYLSLSFDGGDSDNGSRGRRDTSRRSSAHVTATGGGGGISGTEIRPSGVGMDNKGDRRKYHYRKVLVPSQEQLECLGLNDGENEIQFQLDGCVPLKAQLFVWPENSKIIVTDIEGVLLTKNSNKTSSGWVSFLGGGSAKNIVNADCNALFNHCVDNNYRILYITQTNMTPLVSSKDYLAGITCSTTKNGLKIPNGPIFKSPDSLIRAFGIGRTDVFKAAALRGVKSLFPYNHNPYTACFGTKTCDINAYSRFGFPEGRIFLVHDDGELSTSHRLKTVTFKDLIELREEMFPYVQDPRPVSTYHSRVVTGTNSTNPSEMTSPILLGQSSTVITTATAAASTALLTQDSNANQSLSVLTTTNSLLSPRQQSNSGLNTTNSISVFSPSHVSSSMQVSQPQPQSVSTTAEDTYNDFNYWRMPIPTLED